MGKARKDNYHLTAEMGENCLLFIQNRPKRAGAQTSLFRFVLCSPIKKLFPLVLTSSHGWLNEALREKGIVNWVKPWPSPRSLQSRLGGLKKFSRNLAAELCKNGYPPRAIIANDHQECLVAHALSRALGGIPVFAILRTPGMNRRDFVKYQCGKCMAVFPRGKELTARVKSWTDRSVHCLEGSFSNNERYPPVILPAEFPRRILVIGSEEPRKGFSDFVEALALVEQAHNDFPAITCVMTGKPPQKRKHSHQFRSQFEYIGRINEFVNYAREFSLAIHPSRSESFGMAPLELLLAGVPTLVSKTGAINQLQLPDDWCFKPESPRDTAHKIVKLWKRWPDTGLDINSIQDKLLESYHVSRSAERITHAILTQTQPPDA